MRSLIVTSLASVGLAFAAAGCKKAETGPGGAAPAVSAAMPPTTAVKRVAVGELAPAAKVTTHEGKTVTLADYRGKKVLLWFYPAASTPGCTQEGISLRERFSDFTKRGVQILGASVDSPEKNAAFAKDNELPFPLLSDADRTLALAFGAVDKKDAQYTRRVSALIDESGIVRKLYPQVVPKDHAAEVLADIDRLPAK